MNILSYWPIVESYTTCKSNKQYVLNVVNNLQYEHYIGKQKYLKYVFIYWGISSKYNGILTINCKNNSLNNTEILNYATLKKCEKWKIYTCSEN